MGLPRHRGQKLRKGHWLDLTKQANARNWLLYSGYTREETKHRHISSTEAEIPSVLSLGLCFPMYVYNLRVTWEVYPLFKI